MYVWCIIDGFESNSLSSLHVCVKNLTYHSSCYFDAILSTGTQHYFQYNKRSLDSSRLSRLSLAILNFYSLISINIKIDREKNKNSKEISLYTLDRYWGYFAFAKMKSATSTCSRIPIRVIKYLLKIVSKSFFIT